MKTILFSSALVALVDKCMAARAIVVSDGYSLDFKYDTTTSKLNIYAEIPNNAWLTIGLTGTGMDNIDMLMVVANGNSSYHRDLWSTGYANPDVDSQDDYTTNAVYDSSTDTVTFTCIRDLNTGDSA